MLQVLPQTIPLVGFGPAGAHHGGHQRIQPLHYDLTASQRCSRRMPMVRDNLTVPGIRGPGHIDLEAALDQVAHRAERCDLFGKILEVFVHLLESVDGLFQELCQAYAHIGQTSCPRDDRDRICHLAIFMPMPQHAKRIIRESWAVMLSRASSDYEFAGGLFPRFCTCPLRPSAERFDLASPAAQPRLCRGQARAGLFTR